MFVLGPLQSIAPIFLALEMQPQEMVAHGAEILKRSAGGEESFPDSLWLRDGKQSTFLGAQDSDTWAALPAPC